MTAGHNALRGSGLSHKPAFEMHWHEWVVLIAGSTGSALRAVRPPNFQTPSILAVWALMTSSNLLDCTTGRSAGLHP